MDNDERKTVIVDPETFSSFEATTEDSCGDFMEDFYACECGRYIQRSDNYCRECGTKLNWKRVDKGEKQ